MDNMVYHVPVLLSESIDLLNIRPDGVYVDVTYGGGGHSKAILDRLGPNGKLFAFDQDPDALQNRIPDERLTLVHQNFSFLKNGLRFHGIREVDGVLADLGVSSHQFDVPERGFSTRYNAVLDMRMDQQGDLDAKSVLNGYPEEELHRIFGMYGEIANAKTLARAIVAARSVKVISTVDELKQVLSGVAPRGKEHKYYAQLFQALRIEVNGELTVLQSMLSQAKEVVRPKGRLAVIAYHSLEDRLVKNFLAKGKFRGEVDKDFYGNDLSPFRLITKKAVVPKEEELVRNSRSRSAKLRVAEKKEVSTEEG